MRKQIELGLNEFFPNLHDSPQEREKCVNDTVEGTYGFLQKRRHWLKAAEILMELLGQAYEATEISKQVSQLNYGTIKRDLVDIKDPKLKELKQKEFNEEEEKKRAKMRADIESRGIPKDEVKTFKYQFMLNYLSKPTS